MGAGFFRWPTRALTLLAGAVLAGCAGSGSPPAASIVMAGEDTVPAWRAIANDEDVDRLDRADAAWDEALAIARRAGFARQISGEGALLDPGAALARAAPPPGSYRCRVIKLGGEGRGRAFRAFNPFFCHIGVEGELLSITKQTGSERPGGYLHADTDARLAFLGSMALGDESAPRAYGDDPARDMAGWFERVAPFRYRLVVPWPRGDGLLDVFELVPAVE